MLRSSQPIITIYESNVETLHNVNLNLQSSTNCLGIIDIFVHLNHPYLHAYKYNNF